MGRRGQKNVKRPELVERYGYDTKYAGHIVRLGFQGIWYAEKGEIPVPLPRHAANAVLDVRHGAWTLPQVEGWANETVAWLDELLTRNPLDLPQRPDSQAVSTWLCNLYAKRLVQEIQERKLYLPLT
jgi:hypothetical protein